MTPCLRGQGESPAWHRGRSCAHVRPGAEERPSDGLARSAAGHHSCSRGLRRACLLACAPRATCHRTSRRHHRRRARRPLSEFFSACPTARKLEDILLETVHAIERIIPDCIGSIQLIENGKIRNGAAPGLPKFYNDLVEGLADRRRRRLLRLRRRPAQAGHRRGRVHHPYWAPYKEIARQAGFAACWSYPVIQHDGTVIATFATYYRTRRAPTEDELSTIRAFAEILRLAIEQFRNRRRPDGCQECGAGRQPRQEPLPVDDEPRAAHAAQRHHRLLRRAAAGAVRAARPAGLQGLCRQHPSLAAGTCWSWSTRSSTSRASKRASSTSRWRTCRCPPPCPTCCRWKAAPSLQKGSARTSWATARSSRSAPTASRCASCCSTSSTTPSSIRRPAAPSRSTPGRPTAA